MALAISNVFNYPKPRIASRNCILDRSFPTLAPSFVRFSRRFLENKRLLYIAASAAGSSSPDSDLNPYEVLGVSPIEGFDMVKAAYKKSARRLRV